MSTTRPPQGMRRITEVTCVEPPENSHSSTASKEVPGTFTTDEFAVQEEKQSELKCSKPRVEQVFKVLFTIIGLLDHTGAHGSKASRQIWLQLKGKKENVLKAKEYVKGLCDPELQKEEKYPVDMHCIFAGARGLFLDRLLWDTSAEVQVLETGRLKLLGSVEAVVMAQSRVQQFVALFQEKRSLPADREPMVKRTFKTFVEERDDKYTIELLLLPSALKEELLGLAQSPTQPGATVDTEQDRSQTSTPVTELSICILGTSFEDKGARPPPAADSVVVLNGRPSHKRRSSESEQRDTKRQYSLERRDEDLEREEPHDVGHTHGKMPVRAALTLDYGKVSDKGEAVSPETNLRCLVNFFRTMGYQQEVVEKVVREGQTEDAFSLLERIVEKSQRSAQGSQHFPASTKGDDLSPSTNVLPSSSSTCVRLKEKERVQGRAPMANKSRESRRAANSNGLSQRSQTCSISVDDDDDDDVIEIGKKSHTVGPLGFRTDSRSDYLSRGGSQMVGPVRVEAVTMLREASQGRRAAEPRPGCSYQITAGQLPLPHTEAPALSKSVPLTGMSRFQQSLRTPYELVLQDEPGQPDLQHIIIDGSNVAMAHGLNRIFSCRGIAIAVEAFWRRGHREITVFVPQWRQKRDPNNTEQHFLNQLEDLRLLSFTPSREVCGQRITSHDDRFLLHLAEKTGGVIVTNDNMREFVTHSEAWKEIIQKRLLQFTFVEDHFMIPDDPLGKHGPHLEQFLRKDCSWSPVVCPMRTEYAPNVLPIPHASRPASSSPHWPHSGPPDRHPPRPSPSLPPQRSQLETTELKKKLYDIFPGQKQRIDCILSDNPYMRDLNALSGLVLG